MKLTNKHNLPQMLVRAIEGNKYEKVGDVSVTELLQPRQLRHLVKKHSEEGGPELEVDAIDQIWSVLGSSVHAMLERANLDNEAVILERLLTADVNRWKLSGHTDVYDEDTASIYDYKVTSAWSVKDGPKPEWEEQLNCYAYLWEYDGFTVDHLQIVAILRDWSKLEAIRNRDYPKAQVKVIPIRPWTPIERETFVLNRVAALQEDDAGGKVPECTPEEKWQKQDSWAVMKPGAKRATKVTYDEVSATMYAAKIPGARVEYRPGKAVRCESYCQASQICPQFAKESKQRLTR